VATCASVLAARTRPVYTLRMVVPRAVLGYWYTTFTVRSVLGDFAGELCDFVPLRIASCGIEDIDVAQRLVTVAGLLVWSVQGLSLRGSMTLWAEMKL
jgi:hypothetical protein